MSHDEKSPRIVSKLLHDARLQALAFDEDEAQLDLRWVECLRADEADGSVLAGPVTLSLREVTRLEVAIDAADPFAAPSTLPAPIEPTLDEVRPRRAWDDWLLVDPPSPEQTLSEALGLHRIWEAPRETAAPAHHLVVPVAIRGMPSELAAELHASCQRVDVAADGEPLSLERWARQHDAWWQHRGPVGDELDDEDEVSGVVSVGPGVVEAGGAEPPRPGGLPEEPAFEVESDVLEADLRAAVEAYFVAWHARDWDTLAALEGAAGEKDLFVRSRELEEMKSGSAGFARALEDSWIEGDRAKVVVRGIDYRAPAPEEGLAEETLEAVWTFALRKRGGRWVVVNQAEGWPAFGSAPALSPEAKPWLRRWRSTPIHSGDA